MLLAKHLAAQLIWSRQVRASTVAFGSLYIAIHSTVHLWLSLALQLLIVFGSILIAPEMTFQYHPVLLWFCSLDVKVQLLPNAWEDKSTGWLSTAVSIFDGSCVVKAAQR